MKEGTGNDQALREAQLFRTCLHLRRQQRRQLLVNAMRTANAKDASEADLIFAEDRVDFNLKQLARLTKQPDSTSCGWDAHSWAAKAQRSQELLASRRRLHQEFDDQCSQAQLALNRLRSLISLATRASADKNAAPRCQELIAVLQGCEVTLLKGMNGTHEMSERSMAIANTDGSSVFLESVLPKLLTSVEEDLSSDKDFGDDRNAEEEVRLRLMLQDLKNHNEALRREMQELNKQAESSSQGSKGTSEATSATDCDSSEVEAPMLHEIAEMRLALMEAYQELARWQQEDPQASAVIAQHQGLYKSTAGRRGRFAA